MIKGTTTVQLNLKIKWMKRKFIKFSHEIDLIIQTSIRFNLSGNKLDWKRYIVVDRTRIHWL